MEERIILQHIHKMSEEHPDKECILERNCVITYRQHWNAINGYASLLMSKGIQTGTRVAIAAEQTSFFLIAVSALHLIGAVVIPLEKNLSDVRISELMLRMKSVWLIGRMNISVKDINLLDISESGIYLDKEVQEQVHRFPEQGSLADILFTTGTTGEPKGIEVTHLTNKAIAENVIDSVNLLEDDIELIPTPINHSLGLRRYYGAMYRGSTIGIIDGVIYAEDFFDMLKKYRMTAITLVPAMLSILLKFSGEKLGELNKQLRFIQLGSAPITETERNELRRLLPDVRLYNTYGATEAGCTCIFDFSQDHDKMFCIGRPTVNTTVSFVDEVGTVIDATREHLGCMVFEGPMNMKGYWQEPELTKKILRDGKIYTNDIGYRGEDGNIYLLGRKDDVINSGGNKIAPLEIEEIMLNNEKIAECVCVPVEDQVVGQIPKLYVVMKRGEVFSRQEIMTYLTERLEFFKVPKLVEELDVLPRAYNGKILRKELRGVK
ncbi:MAG: acyl--CoA ligase [Lachnospiraceae bacterium]|nr:acyl--CoA ligase [Lachnospiraceae bacterium]